MQSMKCFDCALKHCAGMLSYAKEILGGHGDGNALDHRIDLLGEAVNLEHHLALIDNTLLAEAQDLRRLMQSRQMQINESDLDNIRELYKAIENKSIIPLQALPDEAGEVCRSKDRYLVIIDSPSDSGRFQFALDCLMTNTLNQIDVIVLNPKIKVDGCKVVNLSIDDYVRSIDDDCFVYMQENDFIIQKFDFNLLPDIYLSEKVDNPGLYNGKKVYPYRWDCGAPHILEKDKFLNTYTGNNILDDYYIMNEIKPRYNACRYVVRVSNRLCCGNLSNAEMGYKFATALDEPGFVSLKSWYVKRH